MNDEVEMIFGKTWHVGQLPNMIKEPIGNIKLAMMVRADHPLAGRSHLSMRYLSEFPVATAVELPAGGLAGRGGAIVCNNFHILRDAVIDSDYVWLSPPAFVSDHLREGRLVVLDVADLWPVQTELCMVFKQGRTRSPIAALLTDEVAKILAAVQEMN